MPRWKGCAVIAARLMIVLAIAAARAHGRGSPHRLELTCGRQACMTIRSRRETVTVRHPFRIRSMERFLPAGAVGSIDLANTEAKDASVADN